jgi:[acyl-carrier-protein] S-malonyltransferase
MKTAFLFPGQGAQKCGMGESFAKYDEAAKKVYENASRLLDLDMEELVFTENKKLDMTEYTQAAMVTTGIAMLKVIEKTALKADVCAGLSLGEYEALYLAGVISEEDAIVLARHRGKLMQEAVPLGVGTMAAVLNLDAAVIEDCLKDIENVWIANYNCPGQIVISGTVAAVEKAGEKLKEAGAKRVLPLNVSGPFHSGLLKPAGDKLYEYLKNVEIKKPTIPYVANYTAEFVYDDKDIKELLRKQVFGSVRFEQSIRNMLKEGVDTFIEIGPGKVLGGFVKKIDKEAKVYSIETVEDMNNVIKELGL